MDTQINPCPKCGSQAIVRTYDFYYAYVRCQNKKCYLETKVHYCGDKQITAEKNSLSEFLSQPLSITDDAIKLAIEDWNNNIDLRHSEYREI